jgi:hypothetical protein
LTRRLDWSQRGSERCGEQQIYMDVGNEYNITAENKLAIAKCEN